MEELKDMADYCGRCNIPKQYKDGEIALDQARWVCARCRETGGGIYKFDIAYSLYDKVNRPKNRSGKGETYSKRYGVAVQNLKAEGKSIRDIAAVLGISTNSVVSIIKKLGL